MSRCTAALVFLLVLAPISAQEPVKPSDPPRTDPYGDPLPHGALRRLGTVRFRQEYVHDMAFAPDGKSLIVQSSNYVVQWDVATGKPLRTIPKSQRGNYRSLGLSRDGTLIAVRQDNNSVVVLELATGKQRFRMSSSGQFPGGVISPDNSRIAIGSDNASSSIWDLQTEKELAEFPTSGDLKYSPDGKWLAGRRRERDDDLVILFDGKTGEERGPIKPLKSSDGNNYHISGFGFTPDGKLLLVSSGILGVFIYDMESQKIVRQIEEKTQLIAISPDSKTLVTSRNQTVTLTSIESGNEIRRWQVKDKFLGGNTGAFSPDGKILALPFECGIQLWDPETGKRLDPYLGPIHIPQYLAVSDDAKTIAVLYGRHAGQSLQLFDGKTLEENGRIDSPPFTLDKLMFSPDGRRLAFTEWSIHKRSQVPPRIRIMDVTTGKEAKPEKEILGFFSHWKGSDAIVIAKMNPNPDRGSEWVIVDAVSGKERDRIPEPDKHAFGRRDAWLSPDERLVLTGRHGGDGIAFSETATGGDRFKITSQKPEDFLRAAFSADGRCIIASREGRHSILDSLTFEPLMEFEPLTYYGSSYAFSANGKILVTGDTSAVTVWDLKAALRERELSPDTLTAARLGELWAELGSTYPKIGHRAMVALVRRPDEAVAYLKSRLPGDPPNAATFQRLVRELDDADFKTRQAAQKEIVRIGASAVPMIREALKDPPSIETKRRLESIAEAHTFTDGDRIRWARCAELLERIGTPEARAALEQFRNLFDPETVADARRSVERLAARSR